VWCGVWCWGVVLVWCGVCGAGGLGVGGCIVWCVGGVCGAGVPSYYIAPI